MQEENNTQGDIPRILEKEAVGLSVMQPYRLELYTGLPKLMQYRQRNIKDYHVYTFTKKSLLKMRR